IGRDLRADIHTLSIAQLSRELDSGRLGPVDLMAATLARIEAVEPRVGAFVSIAEDEAMAAARVAEREIAASGRRGPLHGIPVGHKDNIDVRGMATTAASRVQGRPVAAEDSAVARRLREAGAIAVGKLNLLEYASGTLGVYGYTRNPVVAGGSPGGSSSGSGAAVAAGLLPGATGTDTGSSVRNPAAYCGVVGLRPTRGSVDGSGVIPLSWSQDTVGPLARTVEDVALLLEGIGGPSLGARLREPGAPLRFAAPIRFYREDLDPEIAAGIERAVRVLERAGNLRDEIELPGTEFAPAASWTIAYTEAFLYHERRFAARPREFTPWFLRKIVAAGLLSARDAVLAVRVRRLLRMRYASAFERVDVLVVPTTRGLPTSPYEPAAGPDGVLRWNDDFASVARPASLLGLPAISVPVGAARDGSPLAVQLIAGPHGEAAVLRAAQQIEDAVGAAHVVDPPQTGGLGRPDHRPAPLRLRGVREDIDAGWVIREAALRGIGYLTEDDAAVMAPLIGAAKAQLDAAADELPLDDDGSTASAREPLRASS
ncbi:MAG: amidase, partial [Microbacterium sp.]